MPMAALEEIRRLDDIEKLAARKGWDRSRLDERELNIYRQIRGADVQVSVTYLGKEDALHFAFGFQMKIPKRRIAETRHLASLVNERIWLGHFALYPDDSYVLFRATHIVTSQDSIDAPCELLVLYGLRACEIYLPSFEQVARHNYKSEQALAWAESSNVGLA
jgi:hypothetical protein